MLIYFRPNYQAMIGLKLFLNGHAQGHKGVTAHGYSLFSQSYAELFFAMII